MFVYYDYLNVKDSELVIAAQLARLLATENLSCRFSPTAKTASINLQTREAVFPLWFGITKALRHMLIVHEVGHARDTPYEAWIAAIDKIAAKHHNDPATVARAKGMVTQFLNIVEDPRIDKRQKRRFPGCRHDYAVGLRELAARNFFGVDGEDVNQMTFIDRANLHFKSIAGQYPLQFTSAERKLLDRIAATETFDDVVTLTDEIYGLSKSNRKIVTVPGGEIGEGEAGEEGEEIEVEVCQGDGDEDGDEGQGQGDEDGDEGEEVEGEVCQGDGDGDDEDGDEDGDDDSDTGVKGAGASDDDTIPECQTGEALQRALESLAGRDGSIYHYFDLPQVILKNVMDDYKIVIPKMIETSCFYGYHDKGKILDEFRVWRKAENDTISFLAKEFQMRMAADVQARTQIGKTGVIDTNKLYGYKYSDDLFKKNVTVAAGKNHGFVMFLDWSGSMISSLNETMKQLFSLVMFCKRVGVPFEVYLVRTPTQMDAVEDQFVKSNSECYIHFGPFKLRNVLSSRMTTTQLNSAYEILWLASRGVAIASDPLNGTPLNQAILAADKIVNDFRRRNGVQIVNTIIMTDGIAEGASYCAPYTPTRPKQIVRDPITKMMYARDVGSNDTKVLLQVLRARTGTNLVGFFLSASLGDVSAFVLTYNDRKDRSLRIRWNSERYVALTNAGYDEYYLINVGKQNTQNDELVINENMSRHKIKKAYINTRAKKGINRALLMRFVELIAKNKNKD